MHNNYYLLKSLSFQLSKTLSAGTFRECYSQDKDEIVFNLVKGAQEFYIHAILRPQLCMLRFPSNLRRARRNTVDLFPQLIGLTIQEIFCYQYERVIAFELKDGWTLLFKMFEGKANVILCYREKPVELFKKNLVEDLDIDPQQLHQQPDLSEDRFRQLQGDLRTFLPQLGGAVRKYLQSRNYSQKSLEQQWKLLAAVLKELEDPTFYVHKTSGLPVLRMFKQSNYFFKTDRPDEALNVFYGEYISNLALQKEKGILIRDLRSSIKRNRAYLDRLEHRKKEIRDQIPLQVIGDMIMAYMHQIPPRANSIVLPHFETDEPITIKLKSDLSPARNAQQYYRKSKNQKKELKIIHNNLRRKTLELQTQREHLAFIEGCESLKDLREYVKSHGWVKKNKKPQPADLFKVFQFKGFTILVGKNAVNNDLLTRQAHKEDLWMHAKDVKGSHVVVRHQAGKTIPSTVIERAAQLAAYYSKRKQDSLCPVAYTPKKYVRKQKGAPPGQVVVEKEKVILVEPAP